MSKVLSAARLRANKKYNSKFKQLSFRVLENQKDIILEVAAKQGLSVNEYILQCIEFFENHKPDSDGTFHIERP